MKFKSIYSFSPRTFITLCYVLFIACIFYIIYFVYNPANVRLKFHKNIYSNSEYRIDTNGCKIKSLPLFDSENIKFFENKTENIYKCNQTLIEIKRFNETSIRLNYSKLGYKPFCFYRQLSRGSDDFHFDYGEFSGPIVELTQNFPDFDFVHIICYKSEENSENVNKDFNSSDENTIHNQIIPLIPFKEKTIKSSASEVPNILLLAIDSTSYINFKRHFIKTEKFLKENNIFELRGYNKLGDNTFPNLVPFFTGHQWDEIIPKDDLMKVQFDDWPLIWKNFSQIGFVTTFMEDMGKFGLFQFERQGFKQKPTDYETRPFNVEIRPQKYNYHCYLDKTETEHSLDFMYDLIKAMNKRHQKFFAFMTMAEMTHEWHSAGHYMDVPYYQFFRKLFEEKLVENTVIMFFADHGVRLGPLRKTRGGEVESRLPFMFIHLPENIDQNLVENLQRNQYRLTTHFDSHATLVHLIKGEPDPTLPHGLSLLDDKINTNRDCNKAAIPDQYCSCYEDIFVQDHNVINPDQTIPKIVTEIEKYKNMDSHDFRPLCTEYKFDSIEKIYLRRLTTTGLKRDDSKLYIVQLYVNPGMALFETIVKGYEQNTRFEVVTELIRINKYGNQSHCITNKVFKNYCFCRDLVNNNNLN